MKEKLLEKIEQLGGMKSNIDILVSIEDFFEGNNLDGSFAANACDIDFDINEFYSAFKKIKSMYNVQDVWIMITDIDEEWPYSDTALIAISTDINIEDISNLFGKGFPSEIREVDLENEKSIRVPNLKADYKLLCLWWD